MGMSIAGGDVEKLIAHSRAAAPAAIGSHATVVINGEVVAEGSNGWTCMPEVMAGDGAAVCIDATWGEMMGAVGAKAPRRTHGVRFERRSASTTAGMGGSSSRRSGRCGIRPALL